MDKIQKRYSLVMVFGALLLMANECGGPIIVGSEDVEVIKDVIFSTNEYNHYTTKLIARGTVKNVGSATIASPWYVEGQFYTDSTLTMKLGGDREMITVPLEPGTSVFWTLQFSSPDIVESEFPDFVVSQLRAYREE